MKSNALSFIRLGDIADFRNGLNFSKESHGKGCPLIGVGDFKDNFSPKWDELEEINPDGVSKVEDYLKEGDLLFVRSNGNKALVGRSLYINKDIKALYSGFCIRARLKTDDICPLFLAYFTKTQFFRDAISFVAGTNINNLNQGILSEVRIPSYSKEKQALIVKALSSIDKKIELNNRINSELEAMAKTLYDYWFVQFDFPDANGKPYKTSGGKMVYDPTLKREVPDEWEVTTVGKIATTELGGTPSTAMDEYWNDADIPWLSSAETASFPVTTSEQKITQAGIDNSAATLLPKGTVIISIVRYIRPSILGIDAATNQSVVGIRECKRLKSSFIYPYFCSEVPRLMGLRTGAQQPHINKGVIENSPIVIPSDKSLTDYYKIADPIFEKIMNLAFQNQELVQIRDWLLPMLMNGQVTVKPSAEPQEAQHG
ncbi:restriction endonuclease subunit S [Vibrio parahaemolyticus]|nr:restriction endonuclease subunit S [Vibrio parahaemolyticus]